MNRRHAATALLFSFALTLNAQQPGTFGEVLDVRVTNVDVVATDAKGNPVAGLTKDDFEIYEDGKKQEIVNFAEMSLQAATAAPAAAGQPAASPQAAGAAPVPRRFILYVDNGTLSLKNRNEIFTGVANFLSTNLRPGDQAMIVSWNGGSLQVRRPWTPSRVVLDATLKAMAGELGGAGKLEAERQNAIRLLHEMEMRAHNTDLMVSYEQVEYAVKSYAEQKHHDIAMTVSALSQLLSSLAGVDGKKVLIMATESLPTQAGAELIQALENIRTRAVAEGPAPDPSLSGTVTTYGSTMNAGAQRSTGIANVSKYNVQPMIETLAKAANATGVTVYAINPKGTDTLNAGKANLQEPSEADVDFADAVQVLSGVSLLAKSTGGSAMIGAPAQLALSRLSQDLGAYYSIGYRSRPGTAADRKIEVRSKRRGVTMRSRNSIHYRSIETEMADRVIANHLQAQPANELGITLQLEPATTDAGKRIMPVKVLIPTDNLTLLPDAKGDVNGGVSVFISLLNTDGAGGVNVRQHPIHWDAARAAQLKGRRFALALQVPLEKEATQISVGVVDNNSQVQGFATQKIATE